MNSRAKASSMSARKQKDERNSLHAWHVIFFRFSLHAFIACCQLMTSLTCMLIRFRMSLSWYTLCLYIKRATPTKYACDFFHSQHKTFLIGVFLCEIFCTQFSMETHGTEGVGREKRKGNEIILFYTCLARKNKKNFSLSIFMMKKERNYLSFVVFLREIICYALWLNQSIQILALSAWRLNIKNDFMNLVKASIYRTSFVVTCSSIKILFLMFEETSVCGECSWINTKSIEGGSLHDVWIIIVVFLSL